MEPKPLTDHLTWERPEAATAKDEVKALLESPGWTRLMESVELRLRTEQRRLMNPGTVANGEERYERMIGRWAGMNEVKALADGIVVYGERAEAETRAAEAA